MNDLLQLLAQPSIPEDQIPKHLSVDKTFRIENCGAEGILHGLPSRLSGSHNLVRDLVRIDEPGAGIAHDTGYGRFA